MNISETQLPTSKWQAREVGSLLYMTGRPCKRGHLSTRFTASGVCRDCGKENSKAYYVANTEGECERAKRWRQANPEKYEAQYKGRDTGALSLKTKAWRDQNPEYAKQWWDGKLTSDPLYCQLRGIKARCKKNNLEFDLTNDFLMELYDQNPTCPILGIRMLLPNEEGELHNRMSVDRVNPKGGYTKDNVALMSQVANTLKSDFEDPEIFRRLANWLEEKQRDRSSG